MAIKYKEFKKKLQNEPLTEEELTIIQETEDYIDSEILNQFPKSNYGEVLIDLTYPSFTYSHQRGSLMDSNSYRRSLMRSELEKRYKSAGWKIEVKFDDGLDGPNMSGPDYWILKGK
jgi:hypothetical protein